MYLRGIVSVGDCAMALHIGFGRGFLPLLLLLLDFPGSLPLCLPDGIFSFFFILNTCIHTFSQLHVPRFIFS